MRKFKFLVIVLMLGVSGVVVSQVPATEYDQERLRLQQLQTELLEARLALLEKRYEQLKESDSSEELREELKVLTGQLVALRDSLELLNQIVWGMWHDFYNTYDEEQEVIEVKIPVVKSLIGLQPVKLFQGNFELSAERRLGKAWSGEVALMGTYVTRGGMGGGYLKNQDLEYFSPVSDSWEKYTGEMFTGFGIQLRSKNFLLHRLDSNNTAPLGLYAGPLLNYRYVRIRGEENRWIDNKFEKHEVNRHLGIIGAGVVLGYQMPFLKVLALDVYVGGVMRISKYAGEKHLTRYKKWSNIDYTGVLPTAGVRISILK